MEDELEHDIPPAAPPAPEEPLPNINLLDMDETLRYTQGKRMKIVHEVTKKLAQVEDPAMFSALFKGLGDMDKAVIQRKRVGIEEEAVKTDAEAARNSAELLRVITATTMQVPVGGAPRAAPALPDALGEPELVPGELDAEPGNLSYEHFAAGRLNPQAT